MISDLIEIGSFIVFFGGVFTTLIFVAALISSFKTDDEIDNIVKSLRDSEDEKF